MLSVVESRGLGGVQSGPITPGDHTERMARPRWLTANDLSEDSETGGAPARRKKIGPIGREEALTIRGEDRRVVEAPLV